MRRYYPTCQSQPQRFRSWPLLGRLSLGRSLPLLLMLGLFANSGTAVSLTQPQAGTGLQADPTALSGQDSPPPDRLLLAQGFSPNPGGMPGRREGGGTRGPLRINGTPPTALIPATNQGTTLMANPTLYFYVPQETQGMVAEILLMDSDGETIYHGMAPLPTQEGVVSVPLPADLVLEPERNYQWFFSVQVSEDDPSANIILSGWIWRVPENEALSQQLEAMTPSEQFSAYVYAGLWYDALATLAQLRQANPGDASMQAQWNDLLTLVDLQAIAPKPLLDNLSVTLVPFQ